MTVLLPERCLYRRKRISSADRKLQLELEEELRRIEESFVCASRTLSTLDDAFLQKLLADAQAVAAELEELLQASGSYAEHVKDRGNPHQVRHAQLPDKGSNTHAQIDTHISSTANPHQVQHAQLSDKGNNTHAQIDTHISSTANPHQVQHAQLSDGGTNTHAQIDAHISNTDSKHVNGWTAYTPVWSSSNSLSPPSIGDGQLGGWWREIGDEAEYIIQLELATLTGTGDGTWLFSIDTSVHTLDTSFGLFSNQTFLGTANAFDASSSIGGLQVYLGAVAQWGTDNDKVQVYSALPNMNTAATNDVGRWGADSSTPANSKPFQWAAPDRLELRFRVPLA